MKKRDPDSPGKRKRINICKPTRNKRRQRFVRWGACREHLYKGPLPSLRASHFPLKSVPSQHVQLRIAKSLGHLFIIYSVGQLTSGSIPNGGYKHWLIYTLAIWTITPSIKYPGETLPENKFWSRGTHIYILSRGWWLVAFQMGFNAR